MMSAYLSDVVSTDRCLPTSVMSAYLCVCLLLRYRPLPTSKVYSQLYVVCHQYNDCLPKQIISGHPYDVISCPPPMMSALLYVIWLLVSCLPYLFSDISRQPALGLAFCTYDVWRPVRYDVLLPL